LRAEHALPLSVHKPQYGIHDIPESEDHVIERRSGVRIHTLRPILEWLVLHHSRLVIHDHPDPGHARVAIRIHEIEMAVDKNVAQIVTTRHKSEETEESDRADLKSSFHGPI
jgi:hypothetical protein